MRYEYDPNGTSYRDGRKEGAAAERASIVAWMRGRAKRALNGNTPNIAGLIEYLAERIVCGDHVSAEHDAAPPDDGWRPIDDKAQDGEEWLMCGGKHAYGMQMVCFWEGGRWHTADGPSYHPDFFSYYRSLPPPPAANEDEG